MKPGPKPSAPDGQPKRNFGTKLAVDVLAIIRAQPNQAAFLEGLVRSPAFISVAEHLPPVHKKVLVLISDEDNGIYNWPTCAKRDRVFAGTRYEGDWWWVGVPGRYHKITPEAEDGWRVTHWAELPTMPVHS